MARAIRVLHAQATRGCDAPAIAAAGTKKAPARIYAPTVLTRRCKRHGVVDAAARSRGQQTPDEDNKRRARTTDTPRGQQTPCEDNRRDEDNRHPARTRHVARTTDNSTRKKTPHEDSRHSTRTTDTGRGQQTLDENNRHENRQECLFLSVWQLICLTKTTDTRSRTWTRHRRTDAMTSCEPHRHRLQNIGVVNEPI